VTRSCVILHNEQFFGINIYGIDPIKDNEIDASFSSNTRHEK